MSDGGRQHNEGNGGVEYHPPLPENYAIAFPDSHARGYFFKTGEILAREADAELVSGDLAEFGFMRREAEIVRGVVVFANDENADVPRIVDELRAKHERAIVYPHHVAHLEGHVLGGPAGLPRPAEPLEPLPQCCEPGAGVLVGVLDTGAVDHPWYRGRVDSDKSDLDEQPGAGGVEKLDPDAGHGTFIAGVILQHAPGARVLVRSVCNGNGWVEDLELAKWLPSVAPLVNVLNLSLCGLSHDDSGFLGMETQLELARRANPDLVVVAAAGNNGFDRPTYPAAFKRVIGVGAVRFDKAANAWRRADFSNFGWWVDASAPGVDVHSTYLRFEGQLRDGSTADFDDWAIWQGTSFATPRVVGAIAAAMSRGLSAHEVVYRMIDAPSVVRHPDLGVIIDPPRYA